MSEQAPITPPIRESDSVAELAKALAKAQGEFDEITKTKEANAGSYKYKYADLADVLSAVRPALSANGIALLQLTFSHAGNLFVRTRLIHSSGQWIQCEYPVAGLSGQNIPNHQQIGGALTYARRYCLSSILGVAAEEDVDAAGGEPVQSKDQPKKERAAPERQPPAVIQNTGEGKKALPPRVDEKGAGEKKPAEKEAEEIPRFTYTNLEGEPVEGFAELGFVRNLEADITDCGNGGDKDALDGLLSANAEAMKGLSEQSKTTIEKAIEKANKALRAAAVEKDPDGGEPGPMI